MSAPGGGAGTEGVWLEVTLDGAWTRQHQPGLPVTRAQIVEDAVACAEAGAAIVHLHAYDEDSGTVREAYEICAPNFEAIRSRADVICDPTVPTGPRPSAGAEEARARYDVVDRLARAGLIEWSVVDPGPVNLSIVAELRAVVDGFLCADSASDVRAGQACAPSNPLAPSYAGYEPGFLRAGAVLQDAVPGAPRPVYRVMFSTGSTVGFPPTGGGALETCLRMLEVADPGAP